MSNEEKVLHVGAFDTSGNEKDSIVITGWVLDAVLDPAKVEKALSQLVDQWPILAARLRQEKSVSRHSLLTFCYKRFPAEHRLFLDQCLDIPHTLSFL